MQDAPGKISTTADGWTADNSKALFLGVTAHWMDVKDGKWSLRSEVIGFKGVSTLLACVTAWGYATKKDPRLEILLISQ
jgi:hypothetical protein